MTAPSKTPEGKAALQEIWAKKWASAHKSTRNSRILGLVCVLSTPVLVYIFGPSPWSFIPFMGFVFLGDVARVDGLTKKEYYSVPGAGDGEQTHKCIYCGHTGKETHYEGRSQSIEVIICHGCKKRLY